MNTPRPNPTTMEGMVWNANHVLENALKPNVNGLPKGLFEKSAGIIFVNAVKVGFILSGTMGSGVAFRKTENGWSPPCAVGLGGLGFGLLAGVSASDLVIFVFDDESLKSFGSKHGATLGAQIELTIGPFGREAALVDSVGGGNLGATFAIAYSKGVFGGFAAQGGKIGTRDFVNNKFYSAIVTGEDILFKPDSVKIPAHKMTLLNEVYDKLNKAAEGAVEEPDATEEAKVAAAKEAADKEEEAVKSDPAAEVVAVDAEAADDAMQE